MKSYRKFRQTLGELVRTGILVPVILLIVFFVLAINGQIGSYQENVNIQGQVIRNYIFDFQGNPVEVSSDTIHIGLLTSMSGHYSHIGREISLGIELARIELEQMLNRKIWIHYRDSRCDDTIALQHLNSLKIQGVDYIIVADCFGTDETAHLQDGMVVLKQHSAYAKESSYTNPASEHHMIYFDPEIEREVATLFERITMVPESMVIIFPNDYFGNRYKEAIRSEVLDRYDVRIRSSYSYHVGQEIFTRIAEKTGEVDSVFIVAETEDDLIRILYALRSAGFYSQIYSNLPLTRRQAGNAYLEDIDVEGIIFVSDYNPSSKRQAVQDFNLKARALGWTPTVLAAKAYDNLMILAATRYNQDLGGLTNYEGVTGVMSVRNNRLEKTFYVLEIKEGKIEMI